MTETGRTRVGSAPQLPRQGNLSFPCCTCISGKGPQASDAGADARKVNLRATSQDHRKTASNTYDVKEECDESGPLVLQCVPRRHAPAKSLLGCCREPWQLTGSQQDLFGGRFSSPYARLPSRFSIPLTSQVASHCRKHATQQDRASWAWNDRAPWVFQRTQS